LTHEAYRRASTTHSSRARSGLPAAQLGEQCGVQLLHRLGTGQPTSLTSVVERSLPGWSPTAATECLPRHRMQRPVVVAAGRGGQSAPAAGIRPCPRGWRLGAGKSLLVPLQGARAELASEFRLCFSRNWNYLRISSTSDKTGDNRVVRRIRRRRTWWKMPKLQRTPLWRVSGKWQD
jgi:hypothetical protein